MKLSQRVKSISHLKANASDMIRQLTAQREPVVLTVNGEAKAVLQDIESYDQSQETLALLKVLALAGKSVATGKIRPADKAFARLRRRLKP
jgi:prevent-host-death family protein